MSNLPNPIDVHVGRRLKLRRTLINMSQERLGELLGVTFQQVQKYERGANRIGASRLYEIGRILGVPIAYFFDDMARLNVAGLAEDRVGFANAAQPIEDLPLNRRETIELLRAYYRIEPPALRRQVFDLVKALGQARRALTDDENNS